MDYHFRPHEGVGPVRLGMPRAQVQAALGSAAHPFRKGSQAAHETDAFDEAGFHVYYEGHPEVVEFIEVFPVEGIRFFLAGEDAFATPAGRLVESLRQHHEVVPGEEGCSFLIVERDTALWRSDAGAPYFEALGVGERGYYGEGDP